MRKTIRKVTIVVLVFITSCQVSEKRNNGPVNPQTIITDSARMNAIDVPVAFVALSENCSRIWLSLLLFFRAIIASVKYCFALCLDHGQQHLESGCRSQQRKAH